MAKKRKRSGKPAPTRNETAINTNDAAQMKMEPDVKEEADENGTLPQQEAITSELTAYELQRQQLIERNRARLLELGIPMAVVGLQVAAQAEEQNSRPQQASKQKAKPASKKASTAPAPRRSSRLKEHAELQQEADEALSQGERELAMFIIDGECPKCGKVMSRGHRQHYATCAGVEEPTEEELAQEAERRRLNKENKLLALSLRGLVDFTPELAKFIVIGSTGNPYPVTLRSDKRTCACVDHRCRKHDCKHIRLILKQLDIEGEPSKWREAVERHFQSQLSALANGGGGTSGGDKDDKQVVDGIQGQRSKRGKPLQPSADAEHTIKEAGDPPPDPARAQALKFM